MEEVEELKKEIEKLKMELAEYKKDDPVENLIKKAWKPKQYEQYFFITDSDTISFATYDCTTRFSNGHYRLGNCFKTENDARLVSNHLETRAKLQRLADVLNGGNITYWLDDNVRTYSLVYNHLDKEIQQVENVYKQHQGTINSTCSNFKDIAIKEIGKNRLEEYLKGE